MTPEEERAMERSSACDNASEVSWNAADECGYEERVKWCEYCGDEPVAETIHCRDITDTDRGDWIQEYDMDVCAKCAAEHQRLK